MKGTRTETRPLLLLCCLAACALGIATLHGCRREVPGPPISYAPGPGLLTIEEWKKLKGDAKYIPETMERLRNENAELKSNANWKKFMETVFREEFRKDRGIKP